jgi:HEAT repeats
MIKIVITSFILMVAIMTNAGFRDGVVVDRFGKSSPSGKKTTEWFMESRYYFDMGFKSEKLSWQWVWFVEHNRQFIDWEIEKLLKRKVFKMDFMPFDKLELNYFVLAYLSRNPAKSPNITDLLYLYYKSKNRDSYYGAEAIKAVIPYVLLKRETVGVKYFENIKDHNRNIYPKINRSDLIKKYDKQFLVNHKFSGKKMRKKKYDYYMQRFKRTTSSIYSQDAKDWLVHWNKLNLLRDMLKQQAVNDKNIRLFSMLIKQTKKIPNDLANDIIKYFKLNSSTQKISYYTLSMIGVNSKLTAAILKNFSHIKKTKGDRYLYPAIEWALNNKPGLPPAPNIMWKNAPATMSAHFLYNYARASGDYDDAYRRLLKWDKTTRKKGHGKDCRCPSMLQYSYVLLCGNSKLSKKNALAILNSNISIPYNWVPREGSLIPRVDHKYAKLVPAQADKLWWAKLFPFEALSAKTQQALFKLYISNIENIGMTCKTAFKALIKIKSPQYKNRLAKHLLKQIVSSPINRRSCEEALLAIALDTLPEIIKIAGENDDELSIKACELLASMSVFAKSAAPELRKLLQSKRHFTVKIAAMCALAEIGDKTSLPRLKKQLNSKNRLLARAARQAIYMLQPVDKNDKYFKQMRR